jgi:trans-2,3-dihydro-3-hydroxyanthranilate isomerase
MKTLDFYHVDVFSKRPFSGNGLTVFTNANDLSSAEMLLITQEMRQFESLFFTNIAEDEITARVFTTEEELDFAGHPILGAAAVLHFSTRQSKRNCSWRFRLNKGLVTVETELQDGITSAIMNQGTPEFGVTLGGEDTNTILKALNLSIGDLYPGHYPEVISTGLPYVLVPLQQNGLKAKIVVEDMEEMLAKFGAKFIGIVEVPSLTIRTWNNSGTVEDIATGSLAGPVGAWLAKYGYKNKNERFVLKQGGNLGRPSELFVEITQGADNNDCIYVGGHVVHIGKGTISA